VLKSSNTIFPSSFDFYFRLPGDGVEDENADRRGTCSKDRTAAGISVEISERAENVISSWHTKCLEKSLNFMERFLIYFMHKTQSYTH
jgi:hypothetical protein